MADFAEVLNSPRENDVAGRPVKPMTIKIFTSDPNFSVEEVFETGKATTAGQIKEAVLRKLQLPVSCDVFSVWLASKHLQLQLKPYHCPCKLFKRWAELLAQFTTASYEVIEAGDEPVLILQRNAFLSIEEERESLSRIKRPDSMTADQIKTMANLLYCEAKNNVVSGRYPVTANELHMLAGYEAAIEIDLPAETVTADDFRPHLPSLYPSHMLNTGLVTKVMHRLFQSPGSRLEDKTLESYKLACSMKERSDPFNLKLLYLQLCWSKPYYGSIMFVGQIEPSVQLIHRVAYQDQPITVAINPDCIHLFDAGQPCETLLYLTYDQLSWAFEPSTEEGENLDSRLLLEFDSFIRTPNGEDQKVVKIIEIFSRQASMMDAMIEHCVGNINTREAAIEAHRDQGAVSESTRTWKSRDREQNTLDFNSKEERLPCTVVSHDELQHMTVESNF